MKNKIETMLEERIKYLFEELNALTPDTDEYKAVADELVKLLDRDIEFTKIKNDICDKAETRKTEEQLKREEMKDNRRDRWIHYGLTAIGIGAPLVVTVWGVVYSLDFEKEDNVTSIVGRGLIQKLLPKK